MPTTMRRAISLPLPRLAAALVVASVLCALPALASAQEGEPRVDADRYRFDFAATTPGELRVGTFSLVNSGDASAHVTLARDAAEGGWLTLDKASFDVPADGEAVVGFTYRVPADAPPGDHAEAVRILMGASAGDFGLDAGPAILFTSRTLALGFTAIDAPAVARASDPVEGRARVVNTAETVARAAVEVSVSDASGASAFAPLRVDARDIPPNATVDFPFVIPLEGVANGAYTMRARLVDVEPEGAAVGRAEFTKSLLVGVKSVRVTLLDVRDLGDGSAEFEVEVVNTGDFETRLRPLVRLMPGAGGDALDILFDEVTLAPGESRRVTAAAGVPVGAYAASALARSDEVGLDLVPQESTLPFTMASLPSSGGGGIFGAMRIGGDLRAFGLAVLGVAVAGAGVAAYRIRGRLMRAMPRRRKRALKAAPAAPAAPVAVARAERVAVLLDLTTLSPTAPEGVRWRALVAHALAERDAPMRRAYYVATSQSAASKAYAGALANGFQPFVRQAATRSAAARQSHVQITMDAMEAALAGATILLATHDASYADLARRLRERGARVEVMGRDGAIPVELLEHADRIHVLPPDGRGNAP